MKRVTLSLIFLLSGAAILMAPSLAADTGRVEGVVVNATTGAPVAGAIVTIMGEGQIDTTGADGRFAIEVVSAKSMSVKVICAGFETRFFDGVTRAQVATAPLRLEIFPRTAESGKVGDAILEVPDPMLPESGEAQLRDEEQDIIMRRSQTAEPLGVPKPVADDLNLNAGTPAGNYKSKSHIVRAPVPGRDESKRQPPEFAEHYETPYDMFLTEHGTNRFVDARRDHQSTFAIDVDDASYTLVRKYLTEGYLPPSAAVRVEEFVNHFTYDYAPPSRRDFAVFTELTPSPFDRSLTIMKVAVKGRELDRRERKPLNLVLVIDVSGSMSYGNRLDLVRYGINQLVSGLHPRDRIAMVAYNQTARALLQPVSVQDRRRIDRAIAGLHPDGRTNAEAGIRAGYRLAERMFRRDAENRVLLFSDGVANVGSTTAGGIMDDLVRWSERGITLSTFGVGMGNFNDALLEELAVKGNGRYAYLNDYAEVRSELTEDLGSNLQMLARDVKIQVDFNPERVQAYRLIGYENRDIADRKFRDNRQDGGEIGSGHEVTALYELRLNPYEKRYADERYATVNLRWDSADESDVNELARDVTHRDFVGRFQSGPPALQLAIVAERFGELLKRTPYAAEESFTELYRMAEPLVETMENDEVRDLLSMIRMAEDLSRYHVRR